MPAQGSRGSAFAFRSVMTVAGWPPDAAQCSAVAPVTPFTPESGAFGSTPKLKCSRTRARSPAAAASRIAAASPVAGTKSRILATTGGGRPHPHLSGGHSSATATDKRARARRCKAAALAVRLCTHPADSTPLSDATSCCRRAARPVRVIRRVRRRTRPVGAAARSAAPPLPTSSCGASAVLPWDSSMLQRWRARRTRCECNPPCPPPRGGCRPPVRLTKTPVESQVRHATVRSPCSRARILRSKLKRHYQ
jgi:hypothetical protein